jgi:hypothetical protein
VSLVSVWGEKWTQTAENIEIIETAENVEIASSDAVFMHVAENIIDA